MNNKGSCLCGAVAFEVDGEIVSPDACHCVQCRKWTGHFYAGSDIKRSELKIEGRENIKWYQSSEKVRRGFCNQCGSTLFFDPLDQQKHNWIGVAMGAFDSPVEKPISLHIFVAEKGKYYQINDEAKQCQY